MDTQTIGEAGDRNPLAEIFGDAYRDEMEELERLMGSACSEVLSPTGIEIGHDRRLRRATDKEAAMVEIEIGLLSPKVSLHGDFFENAAVEVEKIGKLLLKKASEIRRLNQEKKAAVRDVGFEQLV